MTGPTSPTNRRRGGEGCNGPPTEPSDQKAPQQTSSSSPIVFRHDITNSLDTSDPRSAPFQGAVIIMPVPNTAANGGPDLRNRTTISAGTPKAASCWYLPWTWENPLRAAGRALAEGAVQKALQIGESAAQRVTPNSDFKNLLKQLTDLLQQDKIDEAKDLIPSLKKLAQTEEQTVVCSKLEDAFKAQDGDAKAIIAVLGDFCDRHKEDFATLLGRGIAFWKGEGDATGVAVDGSGWMDPIMGPLMGAPTKPLAKAREALKVFKDNAAVVTALDGLIGEEKMKKALNGKTLESAEQEEIQSLKNLAATDNQQSLTAEQMAPVLAILEKYCTLQEADGIFARAVHGATKTLPSMAQEFVDETIMGDPTKPLAQARAALKTYTGNRAVATALEGITGPEKEKKAFKKELPVQEREAIAILKALAGEEAPLTSEQMAPVLAILETHCKLQKAAGLAAQAPAITRDFLRKTAFPQACGMASGALGPIGESEAREKELATFADTFCREGFVTPPQKARTSLENARINFVTNTVDSVLKGYGSFSKLMLYPLVRWYVNGFEKNGYAFIERLTKEPTSDAEKERQLKLYDGIQFALVKRLETYIDQRLGQNDKTTPADLLADMTRFIVDELAPRFQARQKVADFFAKRWSIFAPISWVFQSVCFVADSICNAISLPLLKWVLVKNNLIGQLIEETNKGMGLGTLHPHGLTKIISDRLNDGLETLRTGETPVPVVGNEILKAHLTQIVKKLTELLDAKVLHGPEAYFDPITLKEANEAVVAQLAGLFQSTFRRKNLAELVHTAYEVLNTQSVSVSYARKLEIEREVTKLQEEMTFLGLFLGIEEAMDKPASLRRTAARFLETVKKVALEKGERLTQDEVDGLGKRFSDIDLIKLDEPKRLIFTSALQNLKQKIQELNEASQAGTADPANLQKLATIKAALTTWSQQDFFKLLDVKPFDPDSMVGLATRTAYKRFQPLIGQMKALVNDDKFLMGAVEHFVIQPLVGVKA